MRDECKLRGAISPLSPPLSPSPALPPSIRIIPPIQKPSETSCSWLCADAVNGGCAAGHSGPIHGIILLHDLCLTTSQVKRRVLSGLGTPASETLAREA